MSSRRQQRPRHGLNRQERSKEAGHLYAELLSPPPRKGWWGSLVVALLLHALAFMYVYTPPPQVVEPPKPKRVVNISQPRVPPPPKKQKPQEVKKVEKKAKKLPIPDPDPEEPEPIKEPDPPPEPELELDLDFSDIQFDVPVGEGSAGFTKATPLTQVKPIFPAMAKTANIREARVKVLLTIDANGRVTDVRWLEGLPIYEEAVLAALKQWVYQPATQDGKPIEYTSAQEFLFKLE